jgi:hypothetical protein
MTADEFRALALALPGAVEGEHMDHPDFRLGGKIFASLGVPDAGWGMVKLTPARQAQFMAKAPRVFSPSAGAWGRQGYTRVQLVVARAPAVRAALRAAAANLAAAGPKRPAKPRAPR